MMPTTERKIIHQRTRESITTLGKNGSEKRTNPYVPIFSRTPARMTEPAVGASVWASGSQVWKGNMGTLMAKAKKKPQKSQTFKGSVKCCAAASRVGTSQVRAPPAGTGA